MIDNPITRAIQITGSDRSSQKASPQPLANFLGVTYQAVRKWEARGYPPAERVLPIEQATAGAVTRHQLRPDLYPDPDWLPPDLDRDEEPDSDPPTHQPCEEGERA